MEFDGLDSEVSVVGWMWFVYVGAFLSVWTAVKIGGGQKKTNREWNGERSGGIS